MRFRHYVVFDPSHERGTTKLQSLRLGGRHERLALDWIRWCTKDGRLIATSDERAEASDKRAEQLEARRRGLNVEPNAAGT